MSRQDSVLVVEDDDAIADLERDYLEASGYSVRVASDGTAGLALALSGAFDLVILDVMLPGLDGMEVCRRIRAALDVPIIMVTARGADIDKIRGLGLGADDYVEKPFSPSVLVARVSAHLSRYRQLKGVVDDEVVAAGSIELNVATRCVLVRGVEVDLRNKEFELLLFLTRNPQVVFDRDTLYERVWGVDGAGDRSTVAVHIKRLRDKVETDPAHPQLIQTVRGAGYRFVP